MVSTAGASRANSPSHRAITKEERQSPTTWTAVRAMSSRAAIPRPTKMGSSGRWNMAAVASSTTKVARGTPATPLLVSMRVPTMKTLLLPVHSDTSRLGNENGGQGKVQGRTIEVEAVAGGDDE